MNEDLQLGKGQIEAFDRREFRTTPVASGVDLPGVEKLTANQVGMLYPGNSEWVRVSDLATLQPHPVEPVGGLSVLKEGFLDDFGFDGYDESDVRELKAYASNLEEALRTTPHPVAEKGIGEVVEKFRWTPDGMTQDMNKGFGLYCRVSDIEALRTQPQAPAVEWPTCSGCHVPMIVKSYNRGYECPECGRTIVDQEARQ